jgi:NAD(P)-dependent dehydrogenase (short-subunit alcohol dehydrogenase family)
MNTPEIVRDGRLAGRSALITGAGSGGSLASIGMAIAVVFAAKGAAVTIVDRDRERAENTRRLIADTGGEASVAPADITDPADCERAVAAAASEFGGVDVLVNSAGIAPAEKDTLSDEVWQQVLDLNLRAAMLMSAAVIPRLRERGGGSIVNISSNAGLSGGGGIAYSAAKSGMIGMTRAMAFHYGRAGIRVNSVAPGHMHTPMGIGYGGLDELVTGSRRLRAESSLTGTEGTAWDVAYASLYLASDESRYVTAHTIPVDGGTTQVMPIAIFPQLARAVAEGDGT